MRSSSPVPSALALLVAGALIGCGDAEDDGQAERAVAETAPPARTATQQALTRTTTTSSETTEKRRPSEQERRRTVTSAPADRSTPPPADVTDVAPAPAPHGGDEPGIAKPQPAPGRAAAPTRSGPLRFTRIRIFKDTSSGRTGGRANVTNRGGDYLNGVRFSWRLLGASGNVLDRGTATWPALAPGETAAVPFVGAKSHSDSWARVAFTFQP